MCLVHVGGDFGLLVHEQGGLPWKELAVILPNKRRNNTSNATQARRPRLPRAPGNSGALPAPPSAQKVRAPRQRARRQRAPNAVAPQRQPVPQPRAPKQLAESTSAPSIGTQIGGFLGNAAQELFTTLLGAGDYTAEVEAAPVVPNNSIMGTEITSQAPIMHEANALGGIRITHREFISDIKMTKNFTSFVIKLNPTYSQFPWLSQIALHYERHRWLGLVFEYRTTSSVVSAGVPPGQGSVIMATTYDFDTPLFASKVNMMTTQFATSCRPSDSMIHPIECEQHVEPLYNFVAVGSDARFETLGRMQLSTVDAAQDFAGAGELWVSYDIILSFPRAVLTASPRESYRKLNDDMKNSSSASFVVDENGEVVYTCVPAPRLTSTGDIVVKVDENGEVVYARAQTPCATSTGVVPQKTNTDGVSDAPEPPVALGPKYPASARSGKWSLI